MEHKFTHFALLQDESRQQLIRSGLDIEFFKGFTSKGLLLHSHDVVEIGIILSGTGEHTGEFGSHPIGPGSVCVTHYHQAHTYTTDGIDIINVYLDLERYRLPTLSTAVRTVLPQWLPLHPDVGHTQRNLVQFSVPDVLQLKGILRTLHTEVHSTGIGRDEAIEHLFATFLIHCCRHWNGDSHVEFLPHHSQRIETVRRFIDNNYQDQHSLEQLSAQVHMTTPSFCRAFKRHTGETIVSYRNKRRLEQALLQLRQSDVHILDIALDCGFNDLSHFNKLFKTIIGQTPRQYRKYWRQ